MSARQFSVPMPLAAADVYACTKKAKFASKQVAKTCAARASRGGVKVRVYECPVCNHWHLTSMPIEIARARRRGL